MPHPPSPLPPASTSDQLPSSRVHAASTEPEHGNLPGGFDVQAQTMYMHFLLGQGTNPTITSQVAASTSSAGLQNLDVTFSGSRHAEAIRFHPGLQHLFRPEVADETSINQQLAEIKQAEKHVRKTGRSAGRNLRFAPILPSGVRYRDYAVINTTPQEHNNRTLAIRYRADRVIARVHQLLTEAGLSIGREPWSALSVADLEEAFQDRLHYHVSLWAPGNPIDDPDSPEGRKDADEQIRVDWQNGDFDNERGATFIAFNDGREWLAWLDDRKFGYNLSTGEVLPGSPSEVLEVLQMQRPGTLEGMDRVFVAPPLVSNALHALQDIPPEKAHGILVEHCRARGTAVTDMNFDEFGRVVNGRYPNVVVARYDRQATDLDALGAILDTFGGRVILAKMNDGESVALQELFVICFDRPGLAPNGSADKSKAQEDLNRIRASPMSVLTYRVRFGERSSAVQYNPKASDSKMYAPGDYSGTSMHFEAPSEILQRFFSDGDQIGIICNGALHANVNVNQERLGKMIESGEAHFLVETLKYAGINVSSKEALVRTVFETFGLWPEVSADLIHRCVISHNNTLPPQEKIKVSVEVIESEMALPDVGENPTGYLLQFRSNGVLANVFFFMNHGVAVFRGLSGQAHPASELNEWARREDWWSEGAVTVLHFEGDSVQPLIEVNLPRPEQDDGPGEDDRKRKRPVSTSSISSIGSELSLRPKPKKVELADQRQADTDRDA